MNRTFFIGAACLLSACGPEPTFPPRTPLPTVERPVLILRADLPEHGAVRVPRAAVVERMGVDGVFILAPDQAARFRMVRVGRVHGDKVDVLSGLNGTETLVLGDLKTVHDGTPIRTN